MSTFDACFAFTMQQEGASYTDDAADPGCWSSGECKVGRLIGCKFGVSAPVLIAWMAPHPITADIMRGLPEATAQAVAGAHFWNPIRGDSLPPAIGLSGLDDAYNTGVRSAAMRLQSAAGLTGLDVDGSIGPASVAAIKACDPRTLLGVLTAAQIAHYRALPGFARYGHGWLARVDRRETAALNLL